jgi:signal transduction histidine kinase
MGVVEAPLVVLLIEDNAQEAELMALRLASLGASPAAPPVELLHAATIAQATAFLRNQTVDVVILDVTLPDARDLEGVVRIREVAPATPVVVLTGVADQALALEALRAGAQDYLVKPPPDIQSLYRILRYARERQRLLRALDVAGRRSARDAERWRLLAEVGKIIATSTASRAAMKAIAVSLVPAAADCVVLILATEEGLPPVLEVVHVEEGCVSDLQSAISTMFDVPASDLERVISGLTDSGDANRSLIGESLAPLFARFGVTVTAAALRFGGRTRGLLVLGVTGAADQQSTDAEFVRSLADRIGLALEQGHLLRESRRAVLARDRAVDIVSHDLRNPLNTIQICAAALLDRDPPPLSGVRYMAELIQRSAAWMQKIVQDLLDRSILDAGRLVLHKRPTTGSELIFGAQAMFAPIAEQHGIEFVVRAADDLPLLDADASRLTQALSNLISNAMKFTPAGGRVVVTAAGGSIAGLVTQDATDPPMVCIAVSDTGPGIPEEDIAHVFDWFWHSHRVASDGAGLGLAIAKGLIEAHGGRLSVHSVLGLGSTFSFTVPAMTAVASAISVH